jgi:CBS domain containing-hemolysin-like protein
MPTDLGLLAVLALVLLNGVFVAAEFALVSVRRSSSTQLAAHVWSDGRRLIVLS